MNNRFSQPISAPRLYLDAAPLSGTEPVRRADLAGLMAEEMPSHEHAAAEVQGLAAAVVEASSAWLVPGAGVGFADASGTRTLRVVPVPGGGLSSGDSGIAADFGLGADQCARGNHSHDQLHDPVSVSGTQTMALALNGQVLSGLVRLAPGGGLASDASGIAVDFGSGSGQAARGDHSHPELVHSPVTVGNTATLSLHLSGQLISGTMRLDAAPSGGVPLAVSSAGVYCPTGTASNTAATGNHSHSSASGSAAGFLSPADFLLLRRLDALDLQPQMRPEMVASWKQAVMPSTGEAIRGSRLWRGAIEPLLIQAEGVAGTSSEATQMALWVEGVDSGQAVQLPVGTGGATVSGAASPSGIVIPPNTRIAWKVASQAASSGNRHSDVELVLHYAMAAHPTWRINFGGAAVYPYIGDRLATGGSTSSTASAVSRSGLTSPAPSEVYQSYRGRTDGGTITISLGGFGAGQSSVVRLHWADIGIGAGAGACVMDVSAQGESVLDGVDVFTLAAGTMNGLILEFEVVADLAGEVEIVIAPHFGTSKVFISGLEAIAPP